ncbi:hypothetical protein EYR97_19610 [Alteromonas sp. KUL42]|uniref:hypothetical protein n=1 Tax=Alteromonas sp. KUL42 TaxID=2480797 RepID=UPI001036886B|nr:hypothetical protein [Alteromonas sp. KUL42]TAP31698.1 hypothetical protein EYR97_19610 [Alteromonas sp. KUL42]
MLNKQKLIMILVVSGLVGCASSDTNIFDHEGKPTMLEMHEKHKSGLYGSRIEKARYQFGIIDSYHEEERIDFQDDLRLPNPELNMVVFPHRSRDGSVSPELVKKFSMYERVHYQVGGY